MNPIDDCWCDFIDALSQCFPDLDDASEFEGLTREEKRAAKLFNQINLEVYLKRAARGLIDSYTPGALIN